MAALVVIAEDIPWAAALAGQFHGHGYAAEVRPAGDDFLRGGPVGALLSLEGWDARTCDAAAELRGRGFGGALMVLGRVAPDLAARQKLAASEAWYLPAFSGPEDVVSRMRMLLP